MRDLFHLIQRIAKEDVTVLVLGESGTGKELVANAVHRHSKRNEGPFVPINCAAIPATLLESELFGHERGSFTGAHAQKLGKFEQAQRGTIFLDEIGDMDALLQAKMLRVLQDSRFQRVGGNQNVQVDVRVIAATNKDLGQEVACGRFREDLFFRLNVIPIFLPPLRNRMADVPLLTEHFVKKANGKYGKQISGISPEVTEKINAYAWPGNIRELENVVTRAVILCRGNVITVADLPLDFNSQVAEPTGTQGEGNHLLTTSSQRLSRSNGNGAHGAARDGQDCTGMLREIDDGLSMQDIVEREIQKMEKDLILAALEKNRWRRGDTANYLQVSRRNLLRKMQKLGIE